MTHFIELAQVPNPAISGEVSLGNRQKERDAQFPVLVADSPFHLWQPGEAIPATGNRLLVGIATWSPSDLGLLDTLAIILSERTAQVHVDVFNVASCSMPDAFQQYVPGIGPVFHTPVVGLWVDGVMTEKGSGRKARELIARVCGLTFEEFEEMRSILARAANSPR